MGAEPKLADYLVSAITSARRLRGKRIYPDTVQYWQDLLETAREAQKSATTSSYYVELLINKLEAELNRLSRP
jgi:hypothetical protein